ncbi:rhombosortase [Oleiharenicola lentus]|uniref:rhombosortase n=1 Tax=Oleiharenicola lentus TaxID=2508720 RepID=UPI003F67FEA6
MKESSFARASALAVTLFALPAIALHFAPEDVRAAWLFNRTAIADGEWWRVVTGHWIHFGAGHLIVNLAVILAAGTRLERSHPGLLARFSLAAAPLVGCALLIMESAMHTFGGLSGLACGVVTLLALQQFSHAGQHRIWWAALLVVIGVKIAIEVTTRADVSCVSFVSTDVRVSTWAHAAGALSAAVFFLSRQFHRSSSLALNR